MVLWRVVSLHKDSLISSPVKTAQNQHNAESAVQSLHIQQVRESPQPETVRRSPRLQALVLNSSPLCKTPVKSAAHSLKRIPFDESELPSKKTKCEETVSFSNKFPRVGDHSYVRIPVRNSLSKRSDLIAAMDSGLLSHKQRKEAVEILITTMYEHIQSWYPHREAKIQLAKDIVEAFPKLKAVTGVPWGAYFDGTAGHIQQALNAKRTQNNIRMRNVASSSSSSSSQGEEEAPSKSKKKQTKAKDDRQSEKTMEPLAEDIEVKIVNLSLTPDTPENRNFIFNEMRELHGVRQNMLSSGKTPEDLLKMFPRLLSYQGHLINQDFEILKGSLGSNFLGTYRVMYQQSILAYTAKLCPQVTTALNIFGDDELKSLLALVAILPKYPCQSYLPNTSNKEYQGVCIDLTIDRLLPHVQKRPSTGKGRPGSKEVLPPNMKVNVKTTVPHPALLQIVGPNNDVSTHESLFYRTRPDSGKVVQPFLLYVTSDNNCGEFYLKANYHTVHLGSSAIHAVSVLFKYHTVFDLEYDIDLLHFYHFFEFMFGMLTKLPATTNAVISALKSA